jgi:outer membrane lipoprotein-sorting protein
MMARRKALICSFIALLIVSSCRAQDSPTTNNPSSDTVVSTTPPFQTKEPERYRATRTITNVTADGKTHVIKHSIAKDGEMRRFESHYESGTLVLLNGPQGRFIVLPGEKIYADQAGEAPPGSSYEDESSPERLLHTDGGNSSYQKLGSESISGRKTEKYRVVVNGANTGNVSSSETLIWIDEALGMPIRSETKSSDGSRSTMELSDISLEVDKNLFQIPGDYKKITRAEMLQRLAIW